MGKGEINPDLGLICRPMRHGGPLIIMVKSKPGVYFDAAGEVATDEMAALARFDVEGDRLIQSKELAKAAALAKIEKQFAADSKDLDGMTRDEMVEAGLVEEAPPATAETTKAGVLVKTSTGEPRAVRLVDGGPVRVMEYEGQERSWKVFDRDSGHIFGDGLERVDASELLVEQP